MCQTCRIRARQRLVGSLTDGGECGGAAGRGGGMRGRRPHPSRVFQPRRVRLRNQKRMPPTVSGAEADGSGMAPPGWRHRGAYPTPTLQCFLPDNRKRHSAAPTIMRSAAASASSAAGATGGCCVSSACAATAGTSSNACAASACPKSPPAEREPGKNPRRHCGLPGSRMSRSPLPRPGSNGWSATRTCSPPLTIGCGLGNRRWSRSRHGWMMR